MFISSTALLSFHSYLKLMFIWHKPKATSINDEYI